MDKPKKIRPMVAWADVGSHGGIFATDVAGCHRDQCQNGRLQVYETLYGAMKAGVVNPVMVKIINKKP